MGITGNALLKSIGVSVNFEVCSSLLVLICFDQPLIPRFLEMPGNEFGDRMGLGDSGAALVLTLAVQLSSLRTLDA